MITFSRTTLALLLRHLFWELSDKYRKQTLKRFLRKRIIDYQI
jgi:hypothetical protein